MTPINIVPLSPNASATADRINDHPVSGAAVLALLAVLGTVCGYFFISGTGASLPGLGVLILFGAAILLGLKGLIVLEPNMAAVCVLFGTYKFTLTQSGFFWVNPFYDRRKVSLRVENFNTATLKVNDRLGNPIEIAAVITWKIRSPARAVFDVSGYQPYIQIQSEMGLRDVASGHAYDAVGDDVTLRGNSQAVTDLLKSTVQSHVVVAGIEILDVKIMHLAYAPEIANVMLRRQQAGAIIQARELLVEGAVTMIQITLDRLHKEGIATLDDAARARLVTSMMTVLLSDSSAQPVIQVGQSAD